MDKHNSEERIDSSNSTNLYLKRNVLHGTSWNLFQLFFSSGFKYLVQLVLAYLLAPKAFGLIGMATVFIGVVDTINDLGLGSALIQKKSEALKEEHYSTVFWITLGFACMTFSVMVIVIAPFVAKFYNEPVMKQVLIVLCIPILLRPLTLIQRIKLTKAINFKPIALIESLGAIAGGIAAVTMAVLGFGVWSIALQGTFSALVTIPSMWKIVRWKPRKIISKQAFQETFSYGVFAMLKSVSTTFMDNIDYLMIGKMLGSYYVGVYTFAFLLTDILRKQIMGIMGKVMFPVYSKIQDQEKMVGIYYIKVIRYNTMIVIPVMAAMIVFAEPLVNIVFNGKWAESILPIQILSISVMFHVATGTFSTALMGIGKAKDDFIIYSIKTYLIYLPVLYFSIHYWGITGASAAVLVYKSISFIMNLALAKHYLSVRPRDILLNLMPSVLSMALILLIYNLSVIFFGQPDCLLALILSGFAAIILYILSIYPFTKKERGQLINWLKTRKS